MLRLIAARALRASTAGSTVAQTRAFALEGAKGFSEHEKAIEDFFFSKEDERALAKLLKKVKSQTQTTDPSASASSTAADVATLKSIVSKYNVSDSDIKALLDWKHAHY